MEPTAAAAVLSNASLRAHIVGFVVDLGDAHAHTELCACACVNHAFAAAAASDALWRAALLRRWPGTLACMAPAALPGGARLRQLYKRRHVAEAATAVARYRTYDGTAAVPLEHRYRFELELFKPQEGGGFALVFSATFSLLMPRTRRTYAPSDVGGADDDCNRIMAASRATAGRVGIDGRDEDDDNRQKAFDLALTTHVSRPLASAKELRSLRSTLTVFRRCPAMGAVANDFAVMQAGKPVVLLDIQPAPSRLGNVPYTLKDGIVRVMAAGELPRHGHGYAAMGNQYCTSDGYGSYYITMQICLDAQNDADGCGGAMVFPEVQPRARLVFTSLGWDGVRPPTRDEVADILDHRVAWSSEHDATAANEPAA